MGIFGQVWLWSSLAFLLGAVLCWLLVALPARRRVLELEADVATRARRQPEREARRQPERESRRRPADARDDEPIWEHARGGMVPGLDDDPDGAEPLTRSYSGSRRDSEPYEVPMNRGRFEPEPTPDPFAPERSEPLFAGPPSAMSEGGLIAPPETQAAETELVSPPAAATQYISASSMNLPAQPLQAPPEVPVQPSQPPSDRGWFDDELRGELADQPPEEQPPLTVRHPPVSAAATTTNLPIQEPSPILSRLVDDDPDGEPQGEPDAEERPRSAIEDDSGGTVFTQRTRPIPGELIRQIDEAGPESLVDDMADDLADDGGPPPDQTVENEPVAARHGASNGVVEQATEVTSEAAPVAETAQEQTVVASALRTEAGESAQREAVEPKVPPGVTVQTEPSKLPKRVPSKPQSRTPFGVMPSTESTRTGSRPAPATAAAAAAGEPTRSLFEPIVPASDGTPVPPPPNKLRDGNGGGRGPFGPGSAMPLPGGASPSPEFTIKASVAALRYCTPESPQFGRTVAEVWFRTAADAERVGFRPVG
jgi:hypothetical protein